MVALLSITYYLSLLFQLHFNFTLFLECDFTSFPPHYKKIYVPSIRYFMKNILIFL